MSERITLTKEKVALVDAADYQWLIQWNWKAKLINGIWYAIRHSHVNGKRVELFMHREIMSAPAGTHVDHRNHDGLDNQKWNLRISTNQQNQQNARPHRGRKYKGVHFDSRKCVYVAQIRRPGSCKRYIGSFQTELQAVAAYDKAAQETFGEFAYLNL